MRDQQKNLEGIARKIVDEHPDGGNADFGVLLNRMIKVETVPAGTKIHSLRAALQNILLGVR